MLCVPVASRATGQVVALACAFNKEGGKRYVSSLGVVSFWFVFQFNAEKTARHSLKSHFGPRSCSEITPALMA